VRYESRRALLACNGTDSLKEKWHTFISHTLNSYPLENWSSNSKSIPFSLWSREMYSAQALAMLAELGISANELEARGLPEYSQAAILELAEQGLDGREHFLGPTAAQAWRLMKEAARDDQVVLQMVSGFRSIERQKAIIERKLAKGQPLSQILAVSAPPCFSQHHTGQAVDIGTPGCPPLEVEFESTSAFDWLQRNAGQFGFSMPYAKNNRDGYSYEPWHWLHGEIAESI
jgi:D-alanyl-D-alanine carboxypeptidase